MFNSLDAGYIPICVLVIVASWFIAGVRPIWRVGVLAIAVPISVSAAWGFLPRLPDLFRPLQFGEDPLVPWIIMAVIVWSAVAAPVGVAAVFLFYQVRKRQSHDNSASSL